MDTQQLVTGLRQKFETEGHRIVFWHDDAKAFELELAELPLASLAGGVTLLRLSDIGALEAKVRLERAEPQTRFLVYSGSRQPEPEHDWLLDIRLYSGTFSANRAAMLLSELGLITLSLKEHIEKRIAFFGSPQRVVELKKLVDQSDTADSLDLKMIAVLARAQKADIDPILIALLHAAVSSGGKKGALISSEGAASASELALGAAPAVADPVVELEKHGLSAAFWSRVKAHTGFDDPSPSLKKLATRMMVSEFGRSLKGADLPSTLKPLLLPDGNHTAAVRVCLSTWRDSGAFHQSYDIWSRRIEREQELPTKLSGFTRQQLATAGTFAISEKLTLAALMNELVVAFDPDQPFDLHGYQKAISDRRTGHWVTDKLPDAEKVKRSAFANAYRALEAVADLVGLRRAHADGFSFATVEAMWSAYTTDLHRFDGGYRRFQEAAAGVADTGADVLKPLATKVEALYTDWFLPELVKAWMPFVEESAGPGRPKLLGTWQIKDVPVQIDFYARNVAPILQDKTGPKRVFVIISDALRYEVAQEITKELNGTYRFKAALSSQLGVLPSYTDLGMAALLPHQKLAFDEGGDVRVDGKRRQSLELQSTILETVHGAAFNADDLLKKSKEDARKAVNGFPVVYIYDGGIDAVGDKAATEHLTCLTARDTINKIVRLVADIVNKMNGSYIIVTADHGFLFQADKQTDLDKSALDEKSAGAFDREEALRHRQRPQAFKRGPPWEHPGDGGNRGGTRVSGPVRHAALSSRGRRTLRPRRLDAPRDRRSGHHRQRARRQEGQRGQTRARQDPGAQGTPQLRHEHAEVRASPDGSGRGQGRRRAHQRRRVR